ncbi:MAG: chemotaxis protein CheX [Fibrobacterota bacterium]
MNAILVTKENFGDDLKDILKKNGVDSVATVKNIGLVEGKLSGKKNIILYDWSGDTAEAIANLRDLMKDSLRERIRVLLIIDEGIKDAITTLVRYDNVRFIFRPLTKERLQIGMRMLMAEKKEPPKMSIDYINPFIEATKMVFKQMAFTDIEKKEVNAENGLRVHGDISGVMALSGKANGFVVISMGFDTAFDLVRKMTHGNVREDEESIIDGGVMELINIISGNAQAAFNQNKYHFDFTTPTMIKGKGHQIDHGIKANSIVVQFVTDTGKEFFLQVCLKHA